MNTTTTTRSLVTVAVCAVTVTPVLRWLILTHSVTAGQPWRTTCACGKSLWPSACGPTGRCRACGIPPGPPGYLIEAVTAVAVTAAVLGTSGPWQAAAAIWWTAGAVVLACVDVSVRRLPHRITAITTAGFLTLQAIGGDSSTIARAILAASVLAAAGALAAALSRRQLGWGDVALAVPVTSYAAIHSWTAVLHSYLAGFAAAVVYLTAARQARRPASTIPLGPFLLAGALIGIHL